MDGRLAKMLISKPKVYGQTLSAITPNFFWGQQFLYVQLACNRAVAI
jgi:hypothetical protein